MEESQSNLLVSRVLRLAILALGVVLATKLVPGIRCDDGWTLLAVVIVLTLFNSFLKPLLMLFALPFLLATMGIGVILINALLLFLVGHIVKGFEVASFGTSILGAIIISVTNLCVTLLIRRGGPPRPPRGGAGGPRRRDSGDVIDI